MCPGYSRTNFPIYYKSGVTSPEKISKPAFESRPSSLASAWLNCSSFGADVGSAWQETKKAFKAAGKAVIEVEVREDMVVRVHSLGLLSHLYFLQILCIHFQLANV